MPLNVTTNQVMSASSTEFSLIVYNRPDHFPFAERNDDDWVITNASGQQREYQINALTPGQPYTGAVILDTAPTNYRFGRVAIYLPGQPHRHEELDREENGSSNVGSALGNLSLGAFTRTTRTLTWAAGDPEESPTGDTYTVDSQGSLGLSLVGVRYEGASWRHYVINQLASIGGYDANTTKQINVSEYTKAYLDQRNAYSGFLQAMLPTSLGINTYPTNWMTALDQLYQLCVTDTRSYVEDPPGSGSYNAQGILTGYELGWTGGGVSTFDVGYSTYKSIADNSRLMYGIPPAQA